MTNRDENDVLVERLRRGICDDRCRVIDAAAGCDCAAAAQVIADLQARVARLEKPSLANTPSSAGREEVERRTDGQTGPGMNQ